MAGSLNHIVGEDGKFTMATIENMGAAREALEECFHIIRVLSWGRRDVVNAVCEQLGYPPIKETMKP